MFRNFFAGRAVQEREPAPTVTTPITFRFLITASLVAQWLCSSTARAAAGVGIRNDTVWRDHRGEEIMCQGGNLTKFGDTFYFYGWGDYAGDNRKDTITCYSSRDLAT